MNVIERLAGALARRDDEPNRELAADIAASKDAKATKELILLMRHAKRGVRVDAARAVASLASFAPKLVAPHWEALAAELLGKEQVMAWPAMIALDRIADLRLKELFGILPTLVKAARRGSVIARDAAVRIFVRFAATPAYAPKVLPILLEELRTCPVMQFPSYVEQTLPVVPPREAPKFFSVVVARLGGLGYPAKIRRVEKALKKAGFGGAPVETTRRRKAR